METITTTQPPLNLKNLNLPQPQPPPSISELRHISAALSQFLRDYDDLHNHIGFVNEAIDKKLLVHFEGIAVNFNDFNNSVKNVLEGSVVERNPRGNVSECLFSDNVLEGVVSERKRNECVVDDDVRMHASSDSFIKDSDYRVVNEVLEGVVLEGNGERSESEYDNIVNDVVEGVVVTEGKCEGSVSESESECECERSDEDARMYESTNYIKKREESDCDRVLNDVLEEKPKGDESDFKRRNEDVNNDEEIDASVKMEENDCEQSDYDVRMRQSPNSSDSCEETDDEDEEIGALKNVEETDYDRAINELLEEIAVIEKNPVGPASKCDKVRTPQSSSSLENSEETDDEDGEIESSKKPEDADYDRIVAELLEDIDVVPKSNRIASDSDQSYDEPQSPTSSKNHLDEIEVSTNPEDENHEQTDVSMEPGEIDIINTVETNVSEKPEEMDIPKNPAETDVSEKPEEMDIPRDPAETDVLEKHEEMDIPKNPVETDVSEKPEEIDIAKNPEETDVSKKPEEIDVSEKPQNVEILKNPKPAVSELERLCKSMSGREMKKYVVKHISDIDKLQKELLKALKLAINPAKLVLDSIGTYFLQSGKTYNRGSYQYLNDQIDGRKASVLILECFVMISGDGIEISREDEAYAAEAANLWKNRMIKEGGLRYIEEADARGLLLLISGFGISDRLFNILDIMDLMRASNVKGISNILRRSIVLMPKLPEVIDMMVMGKLEVEAADIAYTFGLEYKCHPLTILTKFLRNIIDDIDSGSPVQLEAMKQQIDDLISVKECLESHNIDPSKVLPEFKIDEEIHRLKKKLKLQFPVQKRKAMDIESLPNPNHQEAKRTWSSHKTMPCGISSYNRVASSSLLYAPALPVNLTHSVSSGLAGPNGNIGPYGWQDDSALVEKYLVQPYPRQSQTNDSQPSLTGLYGRWPGFPVCMQGHLVGLHAGKYAGYPGYFPSRGFPARRGPGSDLYGFGSRV